MLSKMAERRQRKKKQQEQQSQTIAYVFLVLVLVASVFIGAYIFGTDPAGHAKETIRQTQHENYKKSEVKTTTISQKELKELLKNKK